MVQVGADQREPGPGEDHRAGEGQDACAAGGAPGRNPREGREEQHCRDQREERPAGDEPVAERLTSVARALAYGVLNPAVVQLRRLAISEALRFPGIVTAYWDRAPARTLALLTESFTQMAAQGELDTDDPAAAAALFAYAVLGVYQDQALLQPSRPLARADIDEHVEKMVTAFLRAYAPIAHPQAVSR